MRGQTPRRRRAPIRPCSLRSSACRSASAQGQVRLQRVECVCSSVSSARLTRVKSPVNVVFDCGLNWSFRHGQNRQMQNEYASLPDFALDAYAPAVRRDDVFDQAQPQSIAANLRRHHFFASIERVEDALLLGRRDAQSAIRNTDLNLFGAGRLYRFGAELD